MDKIRFGITGDAFVVFGGDKVLIDGGLNKEHNVGVIVLSELKEKGNTKELDGGFGKIPGYKS